MKSDKVCSPRSPDRNRSEVVGSRVSADLREITIAKSRPRWCRTVLEGRQDRETRERGSVSLCSLRSLRASMCQLFKIHKARGECQERTKFNDLHRLANAVRQFVENLSGAGEPRDRSSLGKVSIKDPDDTLSASAAR